MDKEISSYKKYLRSTGLKNSTITNYLWHLEKFQLWLGQEKLSEKKLKKYFAFLLKKYPQTSSINLRLIILNNFLAYLGKRFRFDLLSQENKDLKILKASQLEEFLDAPLTDKSIIGLRNKVILELLYSSGLKVGQLIKIKTGQIDSIKKEIIFGPRNTLAINPTTWFYLSKYLDKISPETDWLFINFDRSQKSEKRQLSVRSVERIIAKYAKIADPALIINPQILRNTLAWNLKQEGADRYELKKSLHFQTIVGAKNYLQKI
ncbi:MAG: tyrosine-type recombinase/integrase [Patescibacteria group bacterium]|nr:tyrosine-type recombinase/integrase [Patescibacteria group bacterium]